MRPEEVGLPPWPPPHIPEPLPENQIACFQYAVEKLRYENKEMISLVTRIHLRTEKAILYFTWGAFSLVLCVIALLVIVIKGQL